MKTQHLYFELQKAIEESPIVVPCQNTDPEIWFSEREEAGNNYRMAKTLCAMCPAMEACAKYALEAGETDGIWGGLTPRERGRMRAARQRIELIKQGVTPPLRGRLPNPA